jgi:hypothetical protein
VSQIALVLCGATFDFQAKNKFVNKYVDLFCWRKIVDNNLRNMPCEKK